LSGGPNFFRPYLPPPPVTGLNFCCALSQFSIPGVTVLATPGGVTAMARDESDTALAFYGIHKHPQNRQPKQASQTDFPSPEKSCAQAYFA
jgi:hypothetical protein